MPMTPYELRNYGTIPIPSSWSPRGDESSLSVPDKMYELVLGFSERKPQVPHVVLDITQHVLIKKQIADFNFNL
jgi:hypothetical protein